MVADISDNGSGHEALLAAIARQAARAPRQQLTALLLLAIFAAIAAGLRATHGPSLFMALSGMCAATAFLALWELWRRSALGPTRAHAAIQRAFATIGVVLWFLSGMALLLALLGDPWML